MWKDVIGFEDYFRVSDKGEIWSKRSSKLLKLGLSKTGYLVLSTKIGGKEGTPYCLRVHRLVAQAFIPNPEGKPYVNHKDGNKQNNNVSNLEWCTASENSLHSVNVLGNETVLGVQGEKNINSKLTDEDVEYIKRVYKPRDRQYGARSLSRRFGVNHERISKIGRGKGWTHLDL